MATQGAPRPVSFRYLSQEQVVEVGGRDMTLAVDDIEEVFRLHASGDYVLPNKTVLRWGDVASEMSTGRINAMPGYVGGRFAMAGVKWIGSFPGNLEQGLPRASGITILNDPHTGIPVSVLDGTVISAMRTGAVSGVATRYLAREDSRVVGIIGAGVQSRTQLMAVLVARPAVEEVLIYDIREARARAWCHDMAAELPLRYRVAASPREVAESVDILVSATTATSPIVMPGWAPSGLLYLQVGGFECEPAAIREFDRIVVDDWDEIKHRGAQSLVRAWEEGVINDGDIAAHLGEVVVGKRPGRSSAHERIYFSSVGMGIEDVAIATRVLRTAIEREIGTVLDLWQSPAFT